MERAEHPDTADAPTLTVHAGRLEQGLLRDITSLASAAEGADGNPPFSDQTWVELRATEDPDRVHTVTAWLDHTGGRDGELAGAAVVVSPSAQDGPDAAGVLEMVVHPNCRNHGVGAALGAAALERAPVASLRAWSHGNHAAAARLAERFGYVPVRELLRLRLTHHSGAGPDPDTTSAADDRRVWDESVPEGISVRSFRPGEDDAAWLRTNAAAFSEHPEQGSITAEDLAARQAEPWFDPDGFLVAEDTATGADPSMLGFHWTKIHPAEDGHPPLGEVYVVGVAPEAQGRGLGRLLTVLGIRHLQRQGVDAVMLYVDADNAAAVGLYRALGFRRWDTDVMYAPAGSGTGGS